MFFIKNYGLFWKHEDVFWGTQGSPGRLLGKVRQTQKNKLVNFREQIGFYALYDQAFNLVYFGQVGGGIDQTLMQRLRRHNQDHLSGRWSQFSWFGIKDVVERMEDEQEYRHLEEQPIIEGVEPTINGERKHFLNQVEAVVIAVSEPPNNRQGGSFIEAKKYLHHRDSRLGLSTEEKVDAVCQKLKIITNP